MDDFYTCSAVIGGGLMLGQLLLGLLGFGHHTDVHDVPGDLHLDAGGLDHGGLDHGAFDHAGHWFVGLFSLRAVAAALAVFGLAGLAASRQIADPLATLVIAGFAGGGVLYLVGWLVRLIYRFRPEGTLRIERSVGQPGSVYLTIPGENAGAGKVTVKLQGRMVELRAMTASGTLRSGTPVVVVRVLSSGVVEVAPVPAAVPIPGEHHV